MNKISFDKKKPSSSRMNRSQSYSSFSQLMAEGSPAETISSYTLNKYRQHSRSIADLSTTSSTNSLGNRRFHSSHLGRPPGSNSSNKLSLSQQQQQQKPPKLSTINQNIPKIAPMREVEKMITDLKKENFDLKLRLYHLEDLMNKDFVLYQLNEENCRLRMNIEDQTKYIEGLERENRSLIERKPIITASSRSIETQTESNTPITPTNTIDSYHTAFESSPEAFGLLPLSKSSLCLNTSTKKESASNMSWQKIKANEDHISSVVSQLQNFKLTSNNIDSWLNQNVNNHQQGNLRHPHYTK